MLPDLEAVAASMKLDLKLETVELNATGGAATTAGLNISLSKASGGRKGAEDEDSLLEQLSGSGGTPPERKVRGGRKEGLLWAEEEEEEVEKGEVRTEPSNPEGVPEQLLGEDEGSNPHSSFLSLPSIPCPDPSNDQRAPLVNHFHLHRHCRRYRRRHRYHHCHRHRQT